MACKWCNSLCFTIINDFLQILLCFRNTPSIVFKHLFVVIYALIHCIVYKTVCFSVHGHIFTCRIKSTIQICLVNFPEHAFRCICRNILCFSNHNVWKSGLHILLHLWLEIISPVNAFPLQFDFRIFLFKCCINKFLNSGICC